MKSKIASFFICIIILTGVSASITHNVGQANLIGTIYVDDDNTSGIEDGSLSYPYNTIMEGVNAASSGDTVYVFSGIYNENVIIGKTLNLEGENRNTTIIDGGNSLDVVNITGQGVKFENFTVQNCEIGVDYAGIRILSTKNCEIIHNKVTNNDWGIKLYSVSDNIIADNEVSNNGFGIYLTLLSSHNKIISNNISNNSNGIHLGEYSNNNIIMDNRIISSNTNGISAEGYINNNVITGNHIISNKIANIILARGFNNNTISNNTISNSLFGIFIPGPSFNNTIINNDISLSDHFGIAVLHSADNVLLNNSVRSNNEGIVIIGGSNNTLMYNNASQNNEGIYIWLSSYNTVKNNIVTNNGRGIYLNSSSNNMIFHNNIIENFQQVFDTQPIINDWYHPTLLEGNFWSDYTGLDDGSGVGKHAISGDGIGDTLIPHPSFDYDFYPFTNQNGWKDQVNLPPVANPSIDQIVIEGDVVHFDGLSSFDPDGTIVSYEWDFDASDGFWWGTGATPDASGPTPTHVYGDDGVYIVTLRVTDIDNLSATDTCNVTVQNVDPTISIESITMNIEIGLRVAGRKYNNVSMALYEDSSQLGYVSIERMPGSPDEQNAWIPVSINFSKSYNATVIYTPEDPPNIGGNPVWIYIKSKDGSIKKIHHTFNVQQSKKRDSEHWNHVEPWEVELNGHFIGLPFEITSHITDPGSDDEILTFTYGSQVMTVTYLNNPPNPDPYPSPEVNPVDITDMTTLIYEGAGTVMLVVKDDDNIRLGVGEGTDLESVG